MPETLLPYHIDGIEKMIQNNSYYCNYPEDLNIENIKTSHNLVVLDVENNTKNRFEYRIRTHGDVLDNIIIQNCKNVNVSITISGKTLFNQVFSSNYGFLKIRPFKFGIPMIKIPYSTVTLIIETEEKPIVICDFLLLDDKDRKNVAQNDLQAENLVFRHGECHLVV